MSIFALKMLKNHTIPQVKPNFMICLSLYNLVDNAFFCRVCRDCAFFVAVGFYSEFWQKFWEKNWRLEPLNKIMKQGATMETWMRLYLWERCPRKPRTWWWTPGSAWKRRSQSASSPVWSTGTWEGWSRSTPPLVVTVLSEATVVMESTSCSTVRPMCLTTQRTRRWAWWSQATASPLSPWSQRGFGVIRHGPTIGLQLLRMGNSPPSSSKPWLSRTPVSRSFLSHILHPPPTNDIPGFDSTTWETTHPVLHGFLIRAVIAAVVRCWFRHVHSKLLPELYWCLLNLGTQMMHFIASIKDQLVKIFLTCNLII